MTDTEKLEPEDDYYDELDDDADEDDWMDDCGMRADGLCSLAGTEWCDWCCPLAGGRLSRHRPAVIGPRLTPPEGE